MINAKLLIVDDEPQNLLLLRAMLEKIGHEVREASNGREALAVLDRSVDLVLSDVMMPEMDGFTLACHRQSGPDPCGPV
jgi:putative two-component system response regulator